MLMKRLKAIAILLLFLLAAVLYSTDRSQVFVEEEFLIESGSDQSGEVLEGETEESRELLMRVHVCGAVKHSGVYELKPGAIVADALSMAGGVKGTGAKDYLNLAAGLTDGEKIYVPYKAELEKTDQTGGINPFLPSQETGAGMDDAKDHSLVNINTADKRALTGLSGIGEARAQAIIDWREEHGGYQAIEDIMQVSGIKEGAFARIKDQICV